MSPRHLEGVSGAQGGPWVCGGHDLREIVTWFGWLRKCRWLGVLLSGFEGFEDVVAVVAASVGVVGVCLGAPVFAVGEDSRVAGGGAE